MRRRKIFSLITSVFLTASLFLSSASPAQADPYDLANGITTNEMIQGMDNELKSMNSVKIRSANTENSCLYNIKTIVKLATWVDCLQQLKTEEKDKKILGLSQGTMNYEEQKLLEDIKEFNEYYSKTSDKFDKVELMKTSLADNSVNYEELMKDVNTYTSAQMDKMLKDNGNDAKKAGEKNKKALKYIYYICDMNNSVDTRFDSMIPMLPKTDSNDKIFKSKVDTQAKTARELITTGKYKDLIAEGRKISEKDIASITKGDIDGSKGLLKQFLEGADEKDGKVTYSKVSALWYLYFSGSAVYKPFGSKVGGNEIKSALNEVYGTKGEDNDMIRTFNDAIKYRKPLYTAETNGDNKVTGSAKMITLQDLIEKVNDDNKCALVIPKGLWDKAPDNNSYAYYKKNDLINKSATAETKATTDPKAATDSKATASTGKEKDAKTLEYYGNAAKEITDTSQLSAPIVALGSSTGTNQMDNVILSNILHSVANMDSLTPSSQLLYLDVFGDIVLADGTVVYPGATNATMIQKGKNYYPYTVAFLSSYPGLSTSKNFSTTTTNPEGKFIFTLSYGNSVTSTKDASDSKVVAGSGVDKTNTYGVKSFKLSSDKSISSWSEVNYDKYLDCKTYGLDEDIDSLMEFKNYSFNSGNWLKKPGEALDNMCDWYVMTKNADIGTDGSAMSIFTADPSTLESKELGAILKNYYTMAMSDDKEELSTTPDARWDNKVIGDSVIVEVLNGLPNIEGFVNYRQASYDQIVKDSSNRFKVMWMGFTEDVMQGIYHIKGVVGIQNAFQSPALAKVVSYARAFMYFIIVGVLVGVAFMFMRQNYDLFQAGIACVAVVSICWVFVSVVPVYIPTAFNATLDLLTAHKSSDLGYITLMQHMEDYDTTYGKGSTNENLEVSNTTSINLYKYNKADLQKIAMDSGMDIENLLQGTPIIVDANAGIYIEGDTLKCSLDKLLYSNAIVGEYKPIGAGKYYFLTSNKEVSSCFDYYSPYFLVTDALVSKLNNFNMVFPASRETINYGKVSKDSFTMRNYITSIPFLEPDVADNKITEQYDPDIADSAKQYIGDYSDTFGLKDMFKNKMSDKAQESLWYKTMDVNGRLTDEQMTNIVNKTTLNTKQFLIDNYDKFQYMSDENIIKITSLYATVSLTRQMGSFNSELYPMFVNLEEFSLGDILTSAYVSDRSQFRFKSLSLADYMINQYGVGWGSLFALSSVISYLILNITMYEIPILYIWLGILLAIRYIMKWESKKLIKGYVRGSILIFVGYFIHCAGLTLISNMKVEPFTIVIPLMVNLTILDMLVRYNITVFKNPFDLGGKLSFRAISPWIANFTGLTALCASIGGAVGTAIGAGGHIGASGIERGHDQYKHYRDVNGYEEYAGQDAIVGRVMKEQARHRTNRSYEMSSANRNRNGNRNRKGNDDYSEYRE